MLSRVAVFLTAVSRRGYLYSYAKSMLYVSITRLSGSLGAGAATCFRCNQACTESAAGSRGVHHAVGSQCQD